MHGIRAILFTTDMIIHSLSFLKKGWRRQDKQGRIHGLRRCHAARIRKERFGPDLRRASSPRSVPQRAVSEPLPRGEFGHLRTGHGRPGGPQHDRHIRADPTPPGRRPFHHGESLPPGRADRHHMGAVRDLLHRALRHRDVSEDIGQGPAALLVLVSQPVRRRGGAAGGNGVGVRLLSQLLQRQPRHPVHRPHTGAAGVPAARRVSRFSGAVVVAGHLSAQGEPRRAAAVLRGLLLLGPRNVAVRRTDQSRSRRPDERLSRRHRFRTKLLLGQQFQRHALRNDRDLRTPGGEQLDHHRRRHLRRRPFDLAAVVFRRLLRRRKRDRHQPGERLRHRVVRGHLRVADRAGRGGRGRTRRRAREPAGLRRQLRHGDEDGADGGVPDREARGDEPGEAGGLPAPFEFVRNRCRP
mmetsp:Transcript_5081/g.10254  ORF Transcript_5081/g.10254 Transcript_5081/m.10254 type:complete len:410 (-) Transcript_5081:106-1335(-)